MLLEDRVLPHVLAVAERGVEHLALAEILAPRVGVVLVRPLAARHIGRVGVERQQHVVGVAAPPLELVDLIDQYPLLAEVRGRGVVMVFDAHRHFFVPRVTIEGASHQAHVVRELIEGVSRAVHAAESAALARPVDQRRLAFLADW